LSVVVQGAAGEAAEHSDEGHHLFGWDAETATGTVAMMVVAGSVRIVEKVVRY